MSGCAHGHLWTHGSPSRRPPGSGGPASGEHLPRAVSQVLPGAVPAACHPPALAFVTRLGRWRGGPPAPAAGRPPLAHWKDRTLCHARPSPGGCVGPRGLCPSCQARVSEAPWAPADWTPRKPERRPPFHYMYLLCSHTYGAHRPRQIYSRAPGRAKDSPGQGKNITFCGVLPDGIK